MTIVMCLRFDAIRPNLLWRVGYLFKKHEARYNFFVLRRRVGNSGHVLCPDVASRSSTAYLKLHR